MEKETINYTKELARKEIDKICETSVTYLSENYQPKDILRKPNGTYTEDDYYNLPDDVRAELIDGHLIFMDAPIIVHQDLIIEIAYQIKDYIKKNHGKCKILVAPTDVCLTQKDKQKPTIVQPDILIVCDKRKETRKRIEGAPDFVAEILSPSSRSKDSILKLNKYWSVGVKEYWIVDPEAKTVSVHLFNPDATCQIHKYSFSEEIPLTLFNNLSINLAEYL